MHLSLYVPTYHSAGIGGDRVGIWHLILFISPPLVKLPLSKSPLIPTYHRGHSSGALVTLVQGMQVYIAHMHLNYYISVDHDYYLRRSIFSMDALIFSL